LSLSEFGDVPSGPQQAAIEIAKRLSGMAVSFSGMTVNVSGAVISISGDNVIALISGQVVSFSGQVASFSGQYVIATISGNAVYPYLMTSGQIFANLQPTNGSGGSTLTSGIATVGFLYAPNANSGAVYIGFGITGQRPFSGTGIMLEKGERLQINLSNFNVLQACVAVSGDWINYGSFTG
jgi:hypothetical protein